MKTSEIASKINGELVGDPDLEISGLASLETITKNQLSFATSDKTPENLTRIPADACLFVGNESSLETRCTVIRVNDPKYAFAKIARDLHAVASREGWHESVVVGVGADIRASFIGANVTIGNNTSVGEGSVLHDGVRIGDDVEISDCVTLYPNVVVYDNSVIGNDSVIHAGAVIGADGFGYVSGDKEIIKFPHIGKAVIENDVEIGANTCVDRGSLGETRIGESTKIDSLVQIAHNVSIGRRVLIAAQVGISGSVVIEDDVVIGGQVGIADHVTIKSGAIIGARAAVFPGKIVRAGFWAGTPVQPIEKYKAQNALIRSLARMKKEIKELKKHD